MKKNWLAICIIASCSVTAGTKIPKGFELLSQGLEEKVDVIIAGKTVGMFSATVSPDTVKFDEPAKVLEALKLPVKPESRDYQQILQALSAPLSRNGALACNNVPDKVGCGYVKTDKVEAIYDGSDASVTLFMREDWMPVDGQQSTYLAADTNNVENALIHQQDLNVLVQDDYRNLFLQGTDALGISENSYLGTNWSLTGSQSDDGSDNDSDVSNLYYRYDILRQYYMQFGRMDNRTLFNNQGGNFSFSFLPLGAIDGARIGSTLSYLNRDRAGQGSPVMVLLTRNSRVDAYRGNQLLGSFYYSAGNQLLNTSQFPDGSYTVTLQIYESNQLTRTETTAFTKSGGMDDGRVHWFVQGGKISDGQTYNDGNAVQAGVRAPLWGSLSLTAGVAKADGVTSGEGGVEFTPDFGAIGRPSLTTSVFHDDDGGRGDSQQLSWSAQDWPSFNLYRYSVSGSQCDRDNDDYNENYNQLGCYKNMNASVSMNTFGWSNVLSFIRSENHGVTTWDSRRSYSDNIANQTTEDSVSRTWQLSSSRAWSIGEWMMSSTLGAFTRDDDGYDGRDNGFYLSLSLYQSPKQDEYYRSQSTRINADYRDSKNGESQTSYRVSHDWYWDAQDHKELSVEAGGLNSDTIDTALSGRYEGRYGNMSGTLSDSYDRQQNDHTTAFTGGWSSSLAVSGQGVQWGGAGYSDPSAAVLVKVDAIDDDAGDDAALLDARVSGSRPVTLGTGSEALFPLQPYETSTVNVRDSRTASNGATTTIVSGAGSSNVMLLPGKMRVNTVTAEQRFGYVGQLQLPAGARDYPLVGLNSRLLLVAEDGGFTAQLNARYKALFIASGKRFYKCPLATKKRRGVVRYVGDSLCQQISEAALPDSVREGVLAKLKRQSGVETVSNGKE